MTFKECKGSNVFRGDSAFSYNKKVKEPSDTLPIDIVEHLCNI